MSGTTRDSDRGRGGSSNGAVAGDGGGGSGGEYTSFHIRRGEFQFKSVKLSAQDLIGM